MIALEMTTAGYHDDAAERLPDVLAEILQHEPADARAGVERREDEQRLEHDGEVIPDAPSRRCRRARSEKSCAMPTREARRAAGAREQRRLADLLRELLHLGGIEREAPVANGFGGARRRRADRAGRRVDREVDARRERAGGDQRHHATSDSMSIAP